MEQLAILSASNIHTERETPCFVTEQLDSLNYYFNFFPVVNTSEEESIELTAINLIDDLLSDSSLNDDHRYYLNTFAESKHIGCGMALFDGRLLSDDDFLPQESQEIESVYAVHCIYDVRPNDEWLDHFPMGEPCSQCDDIHEKCDEVYSSLCTVK